MGKSKKQTGPARYDQILGQISRSVDAANTDLRGRKSLLRKLEKEGEPQPRRVAMYYSGMHRALSHQDVLPFTSMLKSIGNVQNLDLIVHSPGGDGLAAEKMLDLCRRYCTGKLRVVVPLYAKSAATLMALGADEIIMGETSELGPIDAQEHVIQDGSPQQVSADHFLRAEKEAIDKLGSSNPNEAEAARIYLASFSPAFLQSCRDDQNFTKEFATKELKEHMFAAEHTKETALWESRIDSLVENLRASGKHLSHGRMLTAARIKNSPELQYLKVTELSGTNPYWMALDELLERTDVVAKSQEFGKVLFASNFQLWAG